MWAWTKKTQKTRSPESSTNADRQNIKKVNMFSIHDIYTFGTWYLVAFQIVSLSILVELHACGVLSWSLRFFFAPFAVGVTATRATVTFLGVFCGRLDFLRLASGVYAFTHLGLETLGLDFWGVPLSREDFLGLASIEAALANRLDLRGLASGVAVWFPVLLFLGFSASQFALVS